MASGSNTRRISTINERLQQNRQEPIFLRRVTRIVDDCVRLTSSDSVPTETREYCISRLEALERSVHRARGTVVEEGYEELKQIIQDLLAELRRLGEDHLDSVVHTAFQAERTIGTRGAPQYNVTQEQLSFLVQCGFTIQRVSELLGISISTVKRRIRAFGLQPQTQYSNITDDELDRIIQQTVRSNQRIGPNAVRARLFSGGHRVQRWRVRDSMLRTDPGGAALRAAPSMQRRTYTVAGPNSLWHIDGNHKLIRWKIVIHGGIDGFSRLIIFLHASDNNRKETVLDYFLSATTHFGIPSRIRVDNGGENNDICDVMELLRGPNRGSAIRGRSVHNQRIERNWVDLWNGATNLFYDLFHFMEESNLLHINNDIHLWALHYVFLPRLNMQLNVFVEQWNNHGIRTAHHQSPVQLFVGRSLELSNARLTAMDDIFRSPDLQHTDDAVARDVFDGSAWDTEELVTVPQLPCPLDEEALQRLKDTHNPLSVHDELGINLYMTVVDFINESLQR